MVESVLGLLSVLEELETPVLGVLEPPGLKKLVCLSSQFHYLKGRSRWYADMLCPCPIDKCDTPLQCSNECGVLTLRLYALPRNQTDIDDLLGFQLYIYI